MIVGFIVECGPNGADEQVLKHLVKKLRPDIVPRFSTCGVRGKGEILAKCGTMVTKLFDDEHCAKVFVVWDLMPCNEEHHHEGEPSCELERAHLWKMIRAEDKPRTIMVCIRHELEAWLLADGAALTAVIKRPSHPIKAIRGENAPEDIKNPKGKLRELFKKNKRGDYSDSIHAVKIIREVTSLSRLECAPSFAHFKQKLEAL